MRKTTFLVLVMLLSMCRCSYAQSPGVDLGEIVISYSDELVQESIYQVPASVQVYTQEEIKESGAKNIVEFFEKKTTFTVFDYYGTGRIVNVDLAGFGDTAPSNIAVLVNGRKLNPIDLSGIDWSSVPLDEIEKIEVIQGTGGVLYGDGASSGVINIITRKPPEELTFSLKYEGGSYNYHKEHVSAGGGVDNFSIIVDGTNSSTDGYRANSHYRSQDVFVNAMYEDSFIGDISFEGSHKTYRYGLPAVLYDSNMAQGMTRKGTFAPWDHAQVEDNYAGFTLKQVFDFFSFKESFFYHKKNVESDMISWGSYGKTDMNDLQGRIEGLLNFDTFFLNHNVIAGVEYYYASYSNDTTSAWSVAITDVNKFSKSAFFEDRIGFQDMLELVFGHRWESYGYNIDFNQPVGWPTGLVDEDRHDREKAWELGLNWRPREKTNVYVNYSKTFRTPKADEFLVQWPAIVLNEDLTSQYTKTLSWGINHSWKNLFLGISFFTSKTTGQIYVDPMTFGNENYPVTKRKGAEATIKYNLGDLAATLNYKYLKAKFGEGVYDGNTFYMVPDHEATISLSYSFLKYFTVHFMSSYHGNYFLLNDAPNRFPEAKPVFVSNLKLEGNYKNINVFFGINNLFNKRYNALEAWSYFRVERGFYPAPERNYIWGVELNF